MNCSRPIAETQRYSRVPGKILTVKRPRDVEMETIPTSLRKILKIRLIENCKNIDSVPWKFHECMFEKTTSTAIDAPVSLLFAPFERIKILAELFVTAFLTESMPSTIFAHGRNLGNENKKGLWHPFFTKHLVPRDTYFLRVVQARCSFFTQNQSLTLTFHAEFVCEW